MYLDEYLIEFPVPTYVMEKIPEVIKNLNPVVRKDKRGKPMHQLTMFDAEGNESGVIIWDMEEEECLIYTLFPTVQTREDIAVVKNHAVQTTGLRGIMWTANDVGQIATLHGYFTDIDVGWNLTCTKVCEGYYKFQGVDFRGEGLDKLMGG